MERKHLELMLTAPLKASFKSLLKACVDFISLFALSWSGDPAEVWVCSRVSSAARFSAWHHPAPFPAAAASSAHKHPRSAGLSEVWVTDPVPSLCEHPAVFHGNKRGGFQVVLNLPAVPSAYAGINRSEFTAVSPTVC